MKNIKQVFLLCLSFFILSVNSVFAQGYYGGYGGGTGFFGNFYFPTPDSFLNNEWVLFVSLFLVFFSFFYLALQNIFRKGGDKLSDERRGPVVVIALIIAFIAASYSTYPFYNWLHGYSYPWYYFFSDWSYWIRDMWNYDFPGFFWRFVALPIGVLLLIGATILFLRSVFGKKE